MKTKESIKQQETCSALNLNFDEASELFSDETLQSLQMAKVSGGGFIVTFIVAPVIAGLLVYGITAAINYLGQEPTDGMSEKDASSVVIDLINVGKASVTGSGPITVRADSIIQGKVYGFELTVSPSTIPSNPTK